jgi:hypothetical protein
MNLTFFYTVWDIIIIAFLFVALLLLAWLSLKNWISDLTLKFKRKRLKAKGYVGVAQLVYHKDVSRQKMQECYHYTNIYSLSDGLKEDPDVDFVEFEHSGTTYSLVKLSDVQRKFPA